MQGVASIMEDPPTPYLSPRGSPSSGGPGDSSPCLNRKRRLSSGSSSPGTGDLDPRTPSKLYKVGEEVSEVSSSPFASPAGSGVSGASESLESVVTVVTEASAARGPVGVVGGGTRSGLPLCSSDGTSDPKSQLNKSPESGVSAGRQKVRRKAPSVPALGGPGEGDSRGVKFTSKKDLKSTDGGSRRRLFQQGTRAPAFVEHPVVIHDLGGGAARFEKLGPWHRSQLLANAVGAVRSVRPLPSGKWLIGCSSEAQQSKLARLEVLPGGVPIGARVPRPVVEGVVGPIPMGGDELRLVKQDLEAGGHKVSGVTRLKNKHNEPSLAVKICFEATELPGEVWLGATPYSVQAYAAPVRRCTKCQSLGHTKQQCRSKQTRCSRCGKTSHTQEHCDSKTLSCINCNGRHSAAYKGCPEMLVRQRANILRSKTYIPFTVAMQRARDDLKSPDQGSDPPVSKSVDDCWSRDRVGVAASRTAGTGPPLSYAGVVAGRSGRGGGGGGGPGGTARGSDRSGQRRPAGQYSVKNNNNKESKGSGGGADARTNTQIVEGGTSETAADLFSRISEFISVWGDGPISPLPAEPVISTETSKGRRETSGTEAEVPKQHRPKKSKLRRSKKGRKAVVEKTTLQYQLLLEQQKNKNLEKKLQNNIRNEGLKTELDQLFKESKVDVQQEVGEALSFDGFLWKIMLSLLQTRLTGDCAPLLRNLTVLYNRITGQGRQAPAMSRPLDLMLVLAGVRDAPTSDKLSPVIC